MKKELFWKHFKTNGQDQIFSVYKLNLKGQKPMKKCIRLILAGIALLLTYEID